MNSNQLDTVWITSPFAKPLAAYYSKGPQIGQSGAHGTAFQCTRRSDGKTVAVKEIHKAKIYQAPPGSQKREAIIRAMKTEIEIMKRLKHRYIVHMHETYETKEALHIVMDECKGGELAEKLLQRERLSEKETKAIIRMICEALLHMHQQNMVHLDLKPENILFVDSSSASDINLIDFGLSKILSSPTSVSNAAGTFYYNAPETIRGTITRSADMWSLGVIAFLMVFGFFPFSIDSTAGANESEEVRQKILEGFDPRVKTGFGSWFPKSMRISKDCMDFISCLLEMDPAKRLSAKEALKHPWLSSHRSKELGPYQPCGVSTDLDTKNSKRSEYQIFESILFLMILGIATLKVSNQWTKLIHFLFAKWLIVLLFMCVTFSNFMQLWSITP